MVWCNQKGFKEGSKSSSDFKAWTPSLLLIPTLCGLLEWNPMIARRLFWIIEFPAVWQFTLSEKACKQIFSSICPPLSKAFAQSTQPLSRANPLCCPFVKCSSPTVLLLCQGCESLSIAPLSWGPIWGGSHLRLDLPDLQSLCYSELEEVPSSHSQ